MVSFYPADICIHGIFMKPSLNYLNLSCHLFPVGTLSETPVEQFAQEARILKYNSCSDIQNSDNRKTTTGFHKHEHTTKETNL